MDDLIDSNAELAEAIFKAGFRMFVSPTLDSEWVASIVDEKYAHDELKIYSIILDHMKAQTSQTDLEKARSCVNQFFRDWSAEGAAERSKCIDPVLHSLEAEFALKANDAALYPDKASMRVLVPGAGLGRLLFELCRAGFTARGNEISYHMLMASSLVLNETYRVGQYTIAPFALSSRNHLKREDQFRTCAIPDVHPEIELEKASEGMRVPAFERLSMDAGDFCVVYSSQRYKETFDAVPTVFFIDTAPNIIRYIQAVHNCLKVGGIWINVGPLHWHWEEKSPETEQGDKLKKHLKNVEDAGIGDPGSVELTDEEVIKLVEHFGFSIEKHEPGSIESGYIGNDRGMLQSIYRSSLWIARKK